MNNFIYKIFGHKYIQVTEIRVNVLLKLIII